jgi:hypothetical protein
VSYLSTPRLIFAGQFQADPSTVNNDPEHFDSSDFQSDYQMPGRGATNGWWNPGGTGAWRFRNCTVRQVIYGDGTSCNDPHVDPIVGVPVNDTDSRVEGKLVDLDSEQQMVSELWGFSVLLGGTRRNNIFRSRFKVAPFADIWVRYPAGQPDSFFGAFYQSVLYDIKWGKADGTGSRFLQELSANGQLPETLSIRFNVDGYNDDSTSQQFTFGRVVGAIGLHADNEPNHFVAGRALPSVQPPPQPPLNTAYAEINGSILSLDLGNSLPTQSAGGPLADTGQLYLALLPSNAAPVLLGEVEYRDSGWYEETAGIVSFRLTDSQLTQVEQTPLGIVQWNNNYPQGFLPLLAESANGTWLRADRFVFRLNPGDKKSTTFYATAFGKPMSNEQISLGYDATQMATQTQQGPLQGPSKVGVPETALLFDTTIHTKTDGTFELQLTAADPGSPRQYIDGQVYGINYALGSSPPPVGSVQNPSQILNALVWSGYDVPEQPTWLHDVQPIFQQYANLYPVMRPIVDLADYASVVSRRAILKNVFDTPVTDPNYMPVTRDLSRAKREMIRKWLDRPLYMQLDSVEDLLIALQQAVELEHSTIPPYLCALYSIKPGLNTEVAELIRSVVIEEMLHMALVANLLVSLGVAPRIGYPGFVPRYPGPLPGGLRAGLNVRLRRCSIPQIRDVFMSIEQPEVTVEPVSRQACPDDPVDPQLFTIGWFYDEIKRSLVDLTNAGEISFGHAERQVSDWTGTGKLYVITSLDEAIKAISEIKEQGEGATALDPDDSDRELAHYYKFSEIVAGRRIVIDKTGFSYSGAPIPFDPDGVWPMMDDPDTALLAPGSRARLLTDQFSETYQALLNGLHRTFNGEPGYLNQAIGIMYSLSVVARQLMQTPSGLDGTTAGPSFQLPPPQ